MFENPWVLLLLLTLPPLGWRMFAAEKSRSLRFSSTRMLDRIRPTWRQRIAWLPDAFTLIALAAMIIALARPRDGREQTVIESEGIAIQMVVDLSGSMQAMDFEIDGQRVDRLAAIKNVATKFVQGDALDDQTSPLAMLRRDSEESPLTGRYGDLIGLITFARFADAVTPPTLDHAFMLTQLNHTRIVTQRSEDGTAIGDAISLAVEKLHSLSDSRKQEIESKIVILLTDGENNAGDFDPIQAAELAKTKGIKVYTIGVGTKGRAPFPATHPFTGEQTVQWMQVNIDETTLKEIAEMTGGRYFRATDTQSLQQIYQAIDQLEKTKIESHRFTDYQELAVQSFVLGGWSLPPITLVALLCIAASVLMKQVLIRAIV